MIRKTIAKPLVGQVWLAVGAVMAVTGVFLEYGLYLSLLSGAALCLSVGLLSLWAYGTDSVLDHYREAVGK